MFQKYLCISGRIASPENVISGSLPPLYLAGRRFVRPSAAFRSGPKHAWKPSESAPHGKKALSSLPRLRRLVSAWPESARRKRPLVRLGLPRTHLNTSSVDMFSRQQLLYSNIGCSIQGQTDNVLK
jgi:hypothetical protein